MIELIRTGEGRACVVFCDSCGKRIADHQMAVVVVGPGEQAMFAHKGACHRGIEVRSPLTAEAGFLEFAEAMKQLTANSSSG
jgi:hypothetical protein